MTEVINILVIIGERRVLDHYVYRLSIGQEVISNYLEPFGKQVQSKQWMFLDHQQSIAGIPRLNEPRHVSSSSRWF